jgi:polyprenyl P-hydroxybenzoate/phenylacrylic acid decarboxylase-like protein
VVGITGGPGAEYGVHVLRTLANLEVDAHLVMCGCAADTIRQRTGLEAEDVLALAPRAYHEWNQAARISSGSFLTAGMIVTPCSTRSLASIAHGYANNLIHRAADVTIKEGRPLAVLVADANLGRVDVENVRWLGSVPGVTIIRVTPEPDKSALDSAMAALLDAVTLSSSATSP